MTISLVRNCKTIIICNRILAGKLLICIYIYLYHILSDSISVSIDIAES